MNPIVHAKPKDIVLKLWSVASGQSTDSPPPKVLQNVTTFLLNHKHVTGKYENGILHSKCVVIDRMP